MLITRWQAPLRPSKEQVGMILNTEGLEVFEEVFHPNEKVTEHRHPFTEVRIVISGELIFNVAGNTVLLREGDRIEIPANTRHSPFLPGSNTLCLYLWTEDSLKLKDDGLVIREDRLVVKKAGFELKEDN